MIVMLLVIALFLILGIIFHKGKGAILIAGYNTMPDEEKAQYDEMAITKFMGKMMFALSFSMGFWVIAELVERQWIFYIGMALFIAIMLYTLMFVNMSARFKRQGKDDTGGVS